MSINLHELRLDRDQLADVAAGKRVTLRSDKDMMVVLWRDGTPEPEPTHGVAPCWVASSMIEDLYRDGHTGLVPAGLPYIYSLVLA